MGCDIHGWIEVNRYPATHDPDGKWAWEAVVHLDKVLERTYIAFGRLAHDGSRQRDGDIAPFAGRGIPPLENLGDKTKENYKRWRVDAHHQSHFTHAELTQTRVRVGVGEKDTESIVPIEYIREGLEEYNPDNPDAEFVRSDVNNAMRYGRVKRAWEAAFNVSESLAESNGHEQVRWVIWFDN